MPRSQRSARRQRLAELITSYREQADLKQSEVAARLGRHQPYISEIEAGQRRLDLIALLDLAEAIGFDPRDLVAALIDTPKD